jgi:hypothetical protein
MIRTDCQDRIQGDTTLKNLYIVPLISLFFISGCSSQDLAAIAEGLSTVGSSNYSYEPDPITAASQANTEMLLNAMREAPSYAGGGQSGASNNMNMSCAEWKAKNPNGGHGGAYCNSNIAD